MYKQNKKAIQLGMPIGTASNRLKKELIFQLLKKLNENYCFQCAAEICNSAELSVEHKIPYLDSDNPVKLFFDLENVAFSHLDCNVAAARPRKGVHPSFQSYKNGCRCGGCKEENNNVVRKYRKKKRSISEMV